MNVPKKRRSLRRRLFYILVVLVIVFATIGFVYQVVNGCGPVIGFGNSVSSVNDISIQTQDGINFARASICDR